MSINDFDQKLEAPQTSPSKTETPSPGPTSIDPELIEFTAVADILGMDHSQISKYDSKLRTVMDYIKTQTDDLSPENIKWVVRDVSMRIGSPAFGEKTIDHVARYAFLQNEHKKISTELTSFNKNV